METKAEWQKIKDVFGAALEHSPGDREAFLRDACGSDTSLRGEVESLLKAHDSSSGVFQNSTGIPLTNNISSNRSIGPYQLLEKIGEGGMGQVWLAEQSAPLQRRVALKLIRWGMYDEALLHRFQAERQSLAVMDHPSIAKVFDAGATAEGQPYFVMEYVPGLPITEYCDQKKMDVRDRMELFIKVCEGVQHAHQKAIIHRDLKPANILVIEVDGKPVPRIIDFGLAKPIESAPDGRSMFTVAGSFIGTPGYMSPEQCDTTAQDVDTRTDVYSLGVVLYVLLTGSLPFETGDSHKRQVRDMLRLVREQDPPRPSAKVGSDAQTSSATAQARGMEPKQLVGQLRGDLDWIAIKAIERDRSRRYGTPSELADDLSRHLRYEPVSARPASVSYRLRKYVRRHRIGVAVGGTLAALLIVFAVAQSIQLRKTTRERDRADRIAEFMTGIFRVSDPGERVGNTVTAREILDKASHDVESGLAKDPELQAHMMQVMGIAYLNLGLYQRAQSLLEGSLQAGVSSIGADNPYNLRTMQRLAWALFQQGRFRDAENLQRKTLELRRRILGPDNDETLSIMSDLASSLDEQGKHAEAEKMEREILEKRRRVLGPENSYTLASMDELAAILTSENRLAEAQDIEQQALATQRRVYGDQNIDTIHYMMNAAAIEGQMGRLKESEAALRQVLELQRRMLGPTSPEITVTLYNLASVLGKGGKLSEAMSLLRQAVDIGLPPYVAKQIGEDPDLNALHNAPGFNSLVAQATGRPNTKQSNSRPTSR
ncbi:MAG TPA: serine/threonine-protein kinase [Terriglobales bacterium]|nr:serine/threonine-protein kinase [Terriglobales bacterium]